MTAERPTFSEEGADHPYLKLDNTDIDDAPQVNEFKEAVTAKCALLSHRFAIATNLVLFSLLASVPGTQAEQHLWNKSDASFLLVEEDFPVSAAEGLFLSNAVDHHLRRSLGTPKTSKDDEIIESLSPRFSLSTVTDKSDESRDADIADAKESHLDSISGEGKGGLTSIGETQSMVRTIEYYTDAELLCSLIYNLNSTSNTHLNRFTQFSRHF